MSGASERTSEWPGTPIYILGYSGPLCLVGLAVGMPDVGDLTAVGVVESHALDRVLVPSQLTGVDGRLETRKHFDVRLF